MLYEYELPAKRKIKTLSKGMRTKLALLLALARRARLLILDEPSEGLDPVGIEIAEVERIADHVCILDKGRLTVDDSLDAIRQSYRRIDLSFDALPAEREFQLSGVASIEISGRHMNVYTTRNAEAIVERARDFHANSIQVAPVDLREVFLKTVRDN